MTNYKKQGPDYVGQAGFQVALSNKTPRILYYFHNASGTAKSMIAEGTYGSAYVVPAGKTFYAVEAQMVVGTATAAAVTINSGDTEDAETAAVANFSHPAQVGTFIQPCNFSIAAAKYVTSTPSTTTIRRMTLIGYEA